MTHRENYLSIARYNGYAFMPVHFLLCPSLVEQYEERCGADIPYEDYFDMPCRNVLERDLVPGTRAELLPFYPSGLAESARFDMMGVAHIPSSVTGHHFTRMLHPLANIEDAHALNSYPFPAVSDEPLADMRVQVRQIHDRGLIARGHMGATIWEKAWALRGMEEMMIDMALESDLAAELFRRLTDIAVRRAERFARAEVDVLWLGDDVGTQRSLLMSEAMYVRWIKPHLKRIIDAIRAIRPQTVVFYHSCGYIEPLIPHLIEAGIDVLDPIQPECMDFARIHTEYVGALAFHGTIGTQTTMPLGTSAEIQEAVRRNLHIAGPRGGLFVAPTHVLEPEVPWGNIMAYVQACREQGV